MEVAGIVATRPLFTLPLDVEVVTGKNESKLISIDALEFSDTIFARVIDGFTEVGGGEAAEDGLVENEDEDDVGDVGIEGERGGIPLEPEGVPYGIKLFDGPPGVGGVTRTGGGGRVIGGGIELIDSGGGGVVGGGGLENVEGMETNTPALVGEASGGGMVRGGMKGGKSLLFLNANGETSRGVPESLFVHVDFTLG